MAQKELLRMEHIGKVFPGVVALDDVNFTVKAGTVHALMGENGAGKSTLMKILIGLYQPTSGTITFDGKPLDTSSIQKVLHQGICMIYQELNPIWNMTVAENIYVGREPYKYGGKVIIDYKKMYDDTTALFEKIDISGIGPHEKVGTLSVAKMQMIEIAKAVSYNAKLVIMDEPTSAITEKECQQLFRIVNQLKKTGMSFIFITHKMDEVYQISDELTVLRDGRYVGTWAAEDFSQDELVRQMVGREITDMFPKETAQIGDVRLSVKGLNVDGLLHDISFDLRRGEILGFAGLMGAGRTEVMETLFGLRKADAGEIYIDGELVSLRSPADSIQKKIAFLTEDRRGSGCFLPLSVDDNIMAVNWRLLRGVAGKLNLKKAAQVCKEQIEKFNVKTPSGKQLIANLSGGNQQKALIARWLYSNPEIIIVDEPTRGIDVGSKAEIHRLLSHLATQGSSVIMISSELPEVLGMSDRIVVMHEGRITGILDREEATQDLVMRYATGLEIQTR